MMFKKIDIILRSFQLNPDYYFWFKKFQPLTIELKSIQHIFKGKLFFFRHTFNISYSGKERRFLNALERFKDPFRGSEFLIMFIVFFFLNIFNFYLELMHFSYPAQQLTAHSHLAGRLIYTGSCPSTVYSQHFRSETFLKNPFHTLLIFLTINSDHQRKWVNGTKHTQTQTLFCSIELISILFKFYISWFMIT